VELALVGMPDVSERLLSRYPGPGVSVYSYYYMLPQDPRLEWDGHATTDHITACQGIALCRMIAGPLTMARDGGMMLTSLVAAAQTNCLYLLKVQGPAASRWSEPPPFIAGYMIVDPRPPNLIVTHYEVFAEFRGRGYGKACATNLDDVMTGQDGHVDCERVFVEGVVEGSPLHRFWNSVEDGYFLGEDSLVPAASQKSCRLLPAVAALGPPIAALAAAAPPGRSVASAAAGRSVPKDLPAADILNACQQEALELCSRFIPGLEGCRSMVEVCLLGLVDARRLPLPAASPEELHPGRFIKVPPQPTDPRLEVALTRLHCGPLSLVTGNSGHSMSAIVDSAYKNGLYFLQVQPRDPAIPPFIIGYVRVDPTRRPPELEVGWFEVFAEFRGRGYGKLFAADIGALLADHQGCSKIAVWGVARGYAHDFWKAARGNRDWSIYTSLGKLL
jgi:GNAT superfamily N-acetyltransferase